MTHRTVMAATCRSCGAQIWWATTDPAGKNIPLNLPNGEGNLAVRRDDRGQLVARALVLDEEPGQGETRGTSHFASCPNASTHRNRRATTQ